MPKIGNLVQWEHPQIFMNTAVIYNYAHMWCCFFIFVVLCSLRSL